MNFLAIGVGALRCASGVSFLVAPEAANRLWGDNEDSGPTASLLLRSMGYRDALVGGLLLQSGLRSDGNTAGWFLASAGADAADLLGGLANHGRMSRQQQLRGLGGAALGIGIGVLGAASALRRARAERPRGSLTGVRILLSALQCEKGAIDLNLAEHERVLAEARDAGCALAVFPEMSLTGSLDPTNADAPLVPLDHPAVAEVARLSAEIGVAAVFGIAERNERGPFITQLFAEKGRIAGVQRKRHLGDDEAGFAASDEDAHFELDGFPFAIAICAESHVDRPFEYAQKVGAGLVCFSAAPGLYERRTTDAEWRSGWDWWFSDGLGDAQRHARERELWIAIATQAGSTVDEDFPGLAALVNPSGEVVAQLPDWRAGNLVVEVPRA